MKRLLILTTSLLFVFACSDTNHKLLGGDTSTAKYSSDKEIKSLSIPATKLIKSGSLWTTRAVQLDAVIDNELHTALIDFQTPEEGVMADFTKAAPTISISGQSISPASGSPQDFTNGSISYTVAAADGSTQDYMVGVIFSSTKEVAAVSVPATKLVKIGTSWAPISVTIKGTVDNVNHIVAIDFKAAGGALADFTKLAPTISILGQSISPASGVAQDFTSGEAKYTVFAKDGSTQEYTFKIIGIVSDTDKEISSLSVNATKLVKLSDWATLFPMPVTINGIVDNVNHTVAIDFKAAGGALADFTNLAPTISIVGKSISPASGVPQDFTGGPVTYTVIAKDGSSQEYLVKVTGITTDSSKEVVSLSMPASQLVKIGSSWIPVSVTIDGVIDNINNNVTLDLSGVIVNPKSLAPTISILGQSISPASGEPQDFTGGQVKYTITAKDGTTQDYMVKIMGVAIDTDKEILSVSVPATKLVKVGSLFIPTTVTVKGVVDNVAHTVTIDFTTGAGIPDLTNLVPTISILGKSISPASGVAQNFKNGPIKYTVTAKDGSTQEYIIKTIF